VYSTGVIEKCIRDEERQLNEPLGFHFHNKGNEDAMPPKDIADASLITSGFFPSGDRSTDNYIQSIGKSAYINLADGDIMRLIFLRMGKAFEPLADVMGYFKIDGPLTEGSAGQIMTKIKQIDDNRMREILLDHFRKKYVIDR